MRRALVVATLVWAGSTALLPGPVRVAAQTPGDVLPTEPVAGTPVVAAAPLTAERAAGLFVEARAAEDLAAMRKFRPGYAFWEHVFTIPDGAIAFGSQVDGRLLATFPQRGDWKRQALWMDETLASLLDGRSLETRVTPRRDQVAELMSPTVGPVVHNPTRGNFLLPNARRYGAFLDEWATIYERFGVPPEIGLAQAIIESGLSGTVKSEARAIGFCQWLPRNWNRVKAQSGLVVEPENQTTQAPYCAAYLSILATKYGSFIPALSEHHSGGANVGRTVINGDRLGATQVREQYLMGAQFARDLREMSLPRFREVVRTYGPRSFLYAEMVFGNGTNVRKLRESIPQEQVFAMRTKRAIPIAEVTRKTGLSTAQVQRFNPALVRQVPKGATLYLPRPMEEFGTDVSFWHRPMDPAYAEVLRDFLRLESNPQQWDEPSFEPVLRGFQRRFRDTQTEEGNVMATMLGYSMQESALTRRVLDEYRASSKIRDLFEQGVLERQTLINAGTSPR